MEIAPDGGIWECFLFVDYFRERKNSPESLKYFYGNLEDFMKNHEETYPRVFSNYAQLSMDNFCTSKIECFLCKDYKICSVCPINASLARTPLGKIPNQVCEIQNIKKWEVEKLKEEL